VLCTSALGVRFRYRRHPISAKSDQHLSQFAIKIHNFENLKSGTDFEKARPSAAVSRIDGSGFRVNVPFRERQISRKCPSMNVPVGNSHPKKRISVRHNDSLFPRSIGNLRKRTNLTTVGAIGRDHYPAKGSDRQSATVRCFGLSRLRSERGSMAYGTKSQSSV
jgi:hypothetical protein